MCAALLHAPDARAEASPALVVSAGPAIQSLDGHVDVLLDETQHMDIQAVRQRPDLFAPVGRRAYGKPLRDGTVWLRCRLDNPGDAPLSTMLEMSFPLIDEVEAFIYDGDALLGHHSAGEDTLVANRVVPHMIPRFPLRIPARGGLTVWLRLVDEGALPAPLRVGPPASLQASEELRTLEMGLFLGMFLLVLAYAAYLFFRFREAIYAWLAACLLSMAGVLGVFIWGGAGYWVQDASWLQGEGVYTWWANRAVLATVLGASGTLPMFSIHLLELNVHHRRWSMVLRVLCGAQWVLLASVGVLPYLVSVKAMNSLMVAGLLLMFALTGWRAHKGDRVARMFSAGAGAIGAGALLASVRTTGLIPTNFYTENSVLLGFMVMLLFLSVAVADRIAAVQRARRRALEAQLEEARRNAALSATFEQFVPRQFLERLDREELTDIRLGDSVQKEMTVLFSDIRGFTSVAEHMTPQENFNFVNEFLGYMEPAIHSERGFIDKFIGDAVMALFDEDTRREGAYAPENTGRAGAEHGLAAAIAMLRALEDYNKVRAARGDDPVEIGVGMHTGPLMLGTVGGKERLNASVIGDAVNLAARVEGLTKRYGARVLITAQTRDALPMVHGFSLRPADRVRVKGKEAVVTLYEVLNAELEATRKAKCAALKGYLAAWDAMQAGDFASALAGFEACVATVPGDRAAAVHIERCRRFLQTGVPEGWDGAERMVSK